MAHLLTFAVRSHRPNITFADPGNEPRFKAARSRAGGCVGWCPASLRCCS